MPSRKRRKPEGLPLATDPTASSASDAEPAFVARPEGAPVYHGFSMLEGVLIDGFAFGLITDSIAQPATHGDAFVIAPDGSRAGLVWEIAEKTYFEPMIGPDARRWGVFSVGTKHGPTTIDEARLFLAEILPSLRREWERTRLRRSP
jgi:hypothetical protein